jgi:LysR family transcriptional regulator, hydrogen peroxide-inducible genes activator
MEVHQLRYFMAVARLRSFTRAAEHEHVAQPSLSQQIRKLEDELGARLFNRLGRSITLTPFGDHLEPRARRVLAELDGARQEVDDMLGLRRGTVNLGAIPTLAPYLLPSILTAFARVYPGIAVNMREGLTASLLAEIVAGELDLALVRLPVRGDFVSEPLIKEGMVLAVPRRHPLAHRNGRAVSLEDLAAERFLLLKDGHCFRDDVLQICKRCHLSPNVVFEGGQFDTLVAMVAEGAGVTLLPEMARQHYRHSGVRLVDFAPPRPTRTLGLVRAKEKFLTPSTRAFMECLRQACREQGSSAPAAPDRVLSGGRAPAARRNGAKLAS